MSFFSLVVDVSETYATLIIISILVIKFSTIISSIHLNYSNSRACSIPNLFYAKVFKNSIPNFTR